MATPSKPATRTIADASLRLAALLGGAAVSVLSPAALGQFGFENKAENPVFLDESPAAAESLARVTEYVATGNFEQAVRTVQKVLDDRADELVVSASDPALFEPVRSRAHTLLLGSSQLLARYREAASPGARQMLESGRLEELIRTRLLTHEGLLGSLQLARRRTLDGQFDGAAMTLFEIADHPDREKEAKSVAETAALAARYQAKVAVRSRLAPLLGGGSLPDVEPLARAEAARPASMNEGSGAPLAEDVVNQPLGTGVFGDASMPIRPRRIAYDDAELARIPPFAREMRYWPAVGERALFFSDGQTVTALDRVSMRRLWSVSAADLLGLAAEDADRVVGGMRTPALTAEDEVVQPALTAGGAMLVAVIGRDFDRQTSTEGVEYLTGFDAQTGAVRYSTPLRSLDPALTDCYARGPLVSDGRVVVVTMLKRQSQRRLMASVMMGVDATTGERLWTRLVGSLGVLPYMRSGPLSDVTAVGGGVVYRYDRLGVVGAYTVAEGRPLWVRRLGSKVSMESPPEADGPWQAHAPLLTGAGLVMLTPERDEVLVVDPASGVVTARRKSSELMEPEYLTATQTHLAAVGKLQVATLRLDQVETGVPKASGRLGGPGGIRGRVTASGARLLVPSASGVTVLDPDAPERPLRAIELNMPGSPLALPEGLLVVDDARAHMYCTWAVAAAHLKAQIAASPSDAGPATELLVQAERASKPEEMLPAADSALAALTKQVAAADLNAQAADHRAALVSTLLLAVNRSIGLKVEHAGASLDAAGVDGALDRAGRAARTPGERVAVLLTAGDVQESRREWSAAAETYQRVLQDEALAGVSAPESRGGMTASAAAVERLGRVVRSGGRGAYGAFDARFAEELAALGPRDGTPIEKLEALAARYPLAQRGPALWLEIAGRYASAGTLQGKRAQARALERGVQAAERAGAAEGDPAVAGELNGTLVRNLLDRSLLAAAADALSRAESRFPNAPLTAGGVPMAAAEVRAAIDRDLAGSRRWPRVGAPKEGLAPQVIDGWVLMEPLIRSTGGGSGSGASNAPFIVLHKGDERRTQVALFGLKQGQLAGEAAEGSTARLSELWFSQSGGDTWTLVRTDAKGALFFVGEQNGGRLVRVDADAGKVAWQTEPFGALFPTDPPPRFGVPGAVPQRTSIGGDLRSMAEIILATDDRTVCMVERAGRCAAVDADSGQVLWTDRLPVTRIADATVSGGQLIAVGEFSQPQADNKLDRVALFDARTGHRLAVAAAPLTGVRYIRTTSRGDLILGAGGTIVAINAADLETAKTAWSLTGHQAANAWEAWLLDDRLFLLGDDRSLWEVSAASGAAPTKPIDPQGRLHAPTAIAVWQTGSGVVAFATGRGLALVDGKGELLGVDAVNAPEGTVLPAVIEGGALLLSPNAQRQAGAYGDSPSQPWMLYRLETGGAQILSSTAITFASPPVRMAAVDGRIAVSTAAGTVVLDAPVEAK